MYAMKKMIFDNLNHFKQKKFDFNYFYVSQVLKYTFTLN